MSNMGTKEEDQSAIPIDPNIGDFESNFDRVTDRVCEFPNQSEEILVRQITEIEKSLSEDDPDGDKIRYLAVLEAILDLIEIGYTLSKNGELKLYPPDPDLFKDSPEAYKEHEREILQKERSTQFKEDSVRDFIQKMERRTSQSGSIKDLIVDGEDLYNDLSELKDLDRDEIIEELEDTIQPYVQVVENRNQDDHIDLKLRDIWRYFRYTWLTPYNTVPGRNINFLIRDAARENDPVMGIASLGSSIMNLSVRDDYIGWTIDSLEDRLERKKRQLEYEEQLPKEERTDEKKTRTVTKTEYLETEKEYEERKAELCERMRNSLEDSINQSIENVRYDDFIEHSQELTEKHFKNASPPVFEELEKFEGLARYVIQDRPDIKQEGDEEGFDLDEYGLSKSDIDRIWFEDKDPESVESLKEKSSIALYVKKRSILLQKLLRDRQFFKENSEKSDQKFIEDALESKHGRRAIKTGLREVKKRRVGAGMMNIMVCGAIPPYNEILGGKLVAMALTGPKVIQAYREKYEGYKSKIASAMKGEEVIKENELVFLDTTGLFEVGSAQYDRIRVPVGENTIEYKEIGKTEGYGSVQFGAKARKRLAQVTQLEEGRKVVRGRFGEGIAPRMRKLRRGLENAGLDGDLLKHESSRIIYAVELAKDYEEYLFGETDDPDYFWDFNDIESEQQKIYDHWKERWVSKRIQKENILERIRDFDIREDLLLSHEIKYETDQQKSISQFN